MNSHHFVFLVVACTHAFIYKHEFIFLRENYLVPSSYVTWVKANCAIKISENV